MRLYTTYGTNDLPRAIRFYDAIFSVLEQPRLPGWTKTRAGWGTEPEAGTGFWICRPFDGRPANVGNGTMIAFPVQSAANVRQFHAAGLEHGGTDAGVPGTRDYYASDFYVTYLRDPDGNKLSCFYYHYDPAQDPGD
ncbi:VOC family protein [Ruegeria sp. Ofav3-42]|uniref:VOC family protein n=1 Tax=Ruegeria sp. Ofav3-42 TaxID=2917759 RepID=UPI001EF60A74|nr:VOC family protein [Ruegeria sp. Ofav3-42]